MLGSAQSEFGKIMILAPQSDGQSSWADAGTGASNNRFAIACSTQLTLVSVPLRFIGLPTGLEEILLSTVKLNFNFIRNCHRYCLRYVIVVCRRCHNCFRKNDTVLNNLNPDNPSSS